MKKDHKTCQFGISIYNFPNNINIYFLYFILDLF